MNDWQLIESYVREKSEAAFQSVVERHGGLVYASALRQVGDAQLAQDVAQAVFILLARKASRLRPNTVVAGWLFQTTHFVAARAMRSEQRRQRREQEAFDMQQLSAPDEAWRQLTPVIDEALAQLSRTDRDAILLRFVEGRTLREVSTTLGLTEDAAKKRVTRAVERLRQTLGRKGTAVVSATTLIAALSSHAAAAPANVVAALATSTQTLLAGNASSAAGTLVAETWSAWRWMKLRWLGGAGLSTGALVAVLLVTASPGFKQETPELTHPAQGTQANRNAASAASASQDNAFARARRDNPNLKHLALQVVSAESGAPVPNAPVYLSIWRNQAIENHWELATDAMGRCDLAYEPDAARIDVGVLGSGWAGRYVTWPSEGLPGFPAEYVLRLVPVTNSIGGWIRDAHGRPLEGVQINFAGRDSTDYAHRERPRERFAFVFQVPVTRTDAAGRWTLGFVPETHPGFTLEARHPDFAETMLITSPAQRSLAELEAGNLRRLWAGQLMSTMNTAYSLTGQVVDQQGSPVRGAKIHANANTSYTTDASGQVQVPKLREGEWTFTVTADGFAPLRTQATISEATPTTRIALRAGAVLRVRVVDEDGLEVPDAEVGLEQWGINRHDFTWRERTGFDGRLEWRSAPPDTTLELFVRKDGFCWTRGVRVQATAEEHVITLSAALEVYGRVVDAETGLAIRDFKAMPGYGAETDHHNSQDRWHAGSTVRGTNGMFKLTFEEKQRPWHIRITADDYEEWTSTALTNKAHALLDVPLRRARRADSVRGD